MIISALALLLIVIVEAGQAIRPAWNPALPASVGQMIQFMYGLDNILPMSETFICAGSFLVGVTAFVTFKWVVKLIDWTADIIP